MSLETFDESKITKKNFLTEKPAVRVQTIEEILKNRKKRRRLPRRFFRKSMERQKNILPFPATGTLSFLGARPAETIRKVA